MADDSFQAKIQEGREISWADYDAHLDTLARKSLYCRRQAKEMAMMGMVYHLLHDGKISLEAWNGPIEQAGGHAMLPSIALWGYYNMEFCGHARFCPNSDEEARDFLVAAVVRHIGRKP